MIEYKYCPAEPDNRHSGKRSHASAEDAATALRAQGGKGCVYHCPTCHGWHVSHKRKDELKGRRVHREQARYLERAEACIE